MKNKASKAPEINPKKEIKIKIADRSYTFLTKSQQEQEFIHKASSLIEEEIKKKMKLNRVRFKSV
ncbi:MAG: hypothetical protein ACK4GN_03840 [Runella sp.]